MLSLVSRYPRPQCLDHVTHVYNRTPSRRLEWRTPSEWLSGVRPSVEHLRVFGSAAYVFIPAEVRVKKMAPKSELMVYLGNHHGGKGWIFMRSPNNIIFSAAQAIFDESLFPKCPKANIRTYTRLQTPAPLPSSCTKNRNGDCQCPVPGDEEEDKPKVVQRQPAPKQGTPPPSRGITPPVQDPSPVDQPAPADPPAPGRPIRERKVPVKPGNVYGDKYPVDIEKSIRKKKDWSCVVGERSSRPRRAVPGPSSAPQREVTPPESGSDAPPVSEDEVRGSLEPPSDDEDEEASVVRLSREGGVALQHFLVSKAVSPTAEESSPKEWTSRDILRLPKGCLEEWRTACERELDTLNRRNVFDLVERPRGRKVIRNRWVFDIKDDGRKRARLVAKGFSQVEGLDYDQVFSPVVRFKTVRLILALAALENWVAYGLDVRNAYLYGELDEEIHMEQPEGFRVPGKENHVLRLNKALYGLKQAGLAWWRALKESMEKLGFISLSSDAGVFLYRNKDFFVIAIIYVDDAIFCGPSKLMVNTMKEAFMQRWETRDLGEVTEFLRMRIVREGRSIHLDQTAYLQTVLQRCGMQNAKAAATPLPAGYVLTPSTEAADPERRSRFQTVIGSLLYLMLGTLGAMVPGNQ